MPTVKNLENIKMFTDVDKHLKSHVFKANFDTVWAHVLPVFILHTFSFFLVRLNCKCYLHVLLSKFNTSFPI